MVKRILHEISGLSNGGVESLLVNLHRNIDRDIVQFDYILSHDWGTETDLYSSEIRRLGGRIFYLPGGVRQFTAFYRFLKAHPEYTVVHSHRGAFGSLYLLIACFAGIKYRILHSHCAYRDERITSFFTRCLRPLILMVSTKLYACGENAGNYLYGKRAKFEVLKNGIDFSRFRFDCKIGEKMKSSLNIPSDAIVYGHVGRFSHPKNHLFLIDVFAEIHKCDPNAILLLVGDGELKEVIEEKIDTFGLSENVRILSNRNDVNKILQVMDLVIFPSLYEGFSFAMLEMQSSSLRILCSDSIGREINLTGEVYFKSLEDRPDSWAQEALKLSKYEKREIDISPIPKSGYDVKDVAGNIQQYYLSLK